MALAEPWADVDIKAQPDPKSQTDDGMNILSDTETHLDIVIVPDTSGIDVEVWGVWWPLHQYGFGTLFFILCIYALYATILRIFRNHAGGGMRSRKAVQPVFTCINVLVFLLGLSNTIMLFLDPYLFNRKLPLLLGVILINMPFPCMTSAFALVNWVLLSISQMRMTKASRLRSVWFLIGMILTHFVLIIGASLVLVLISPLLILGIICHGFSVLWGAVLCISYIYSAWKIVSAEKHNRKTLYDISIRDSSVADTHGSVQANGRFQISRKIPQRLSSIFTRNNKQQDSSSDKAIFSIGQNENVQQILTPMPSCLMDSEFETKLTATDDVSEESSDAQNNEMAGHTASTQNKTETWELKHSKNTNMDMINEDSPRHKGRPKTEAPQNGRSKTGKKIGVSRFPTSGQAPDKGSKGMSSQSGKQRGKLDRQSGSKMSGTGRPQRSTQKVFRISAITAVLGITASGLGLYGILGLMTAGAADQPSEWGWYVFQTCFRFVELGMGCTMAYFTTQPFPRRRQR